MVFHVSLTKQIVEDHGLSPRTVESHSAAIGAKLGTISQVKMTRVWIDRGATLRRTTEGVWSPTNFSAPLGSVNSPHHS
ncbi:hypothetical protein GP644_22285 [Parasedimentitalea maritima]|uniref:HTH luxR-type domain-containing protein n=1 Tax=Parasedimentitalea maritima TaxID=2578117 RepID=A0A6A4RCP6_9RHOB|nr:hypothetical protein GP644_22285 [Zongyanglinia marina]